VAALDATEYEAIASAGAAPEIDPAGHDATGLGRRVPSAARPTHRADADDLQVIAVAFVTTLALRVRRQRDNLRAA